MDKSKTASSDSGDGVRNTLHGDESKHVQLNDGKQAWAMVQLNDGELSVTLHDTEEAACQDIIDTVLFDTAWINLYRDGNEAEIVLLKQEIERHTAKEAYATLIKPRFQGRDSGFYMEVAPASYATKVTA